MIWLLICKTETCPDLGQPAVFATETEESPTVVCGRCDTQYTDITLEGVI